MKFVSACPFLLAFGVNLIMNLLSYIVYFTILLELVGFCGKSLCGSLLGLLSRECGS